jgi:ribosome-binding factor A
MKYLPELEFEEDTTFEQGERIDRLLAELHRGDDP